MPSKKKEIEKIVKQIRKCRKCSLWERAKNAVPGEGPANAKIMFIGEAPGREEDLSGKPFVGRAGKLLTLLLGKNKLKRKNVFITSVIKHRPPKNRKPEKKEIRACLPYLKRQIEILNPRKIILLGDIAFKLFFPDKKLKYFRGKLIKKDDKNYFITYHPAAGIRFQKFREILEKDFKKI
jgi:uracil-DNA glycosylase family 4